VASKKKESLEDRLETGRNINTDFFLGHFGITPEWSEAYLLLLILLLCKNSFILSFFEER
jgi:hypothetical protein